MDRLSVAIYKFALSRFLYNTTIQYTLFFFFLVWLLSFSIIVLRFIHAVCVFQELILLVSSISSDGYYTICLSTQLLMGISGFHILDITNKTAVHTDV